MVYEKRDWSGLIRAMNRLTLLILILALPALVIPLGFSLCVCEDCGCDSLQVEEVSSCCSTGERSEKKTKSCDRLVVDGPEQDFEAPVSIPEFVIPCFEAPQLSVALASDFVGGHCTLTPSTTPPPRLSPLLV